MAQELLMGTKAEMEKMRELYERECEKVARLKTFVCEQEKQCDELANLIKTLTKERDNWSEKAEQRALEVQELRQKATTNEGKLCETSRLRDELSRFKDKASFLEVNFWDNLIIVHLNTANQNIANLTMILLITLFAAPNQNPSH